MNAPTGYTALDLVGFTDKGTYSASAVYAANDIVHLNGNNLWRCLIDDTTGITPEEGANWTIFVRSDVGDLSELETDDKSSAVAALNELVEEVDRLIVVSQGDTELDETSENWVQNKVITKQFTDRGLSVVNGQLCITYNT